MHSPHVNRPEHGAPRKPHAVSTPKEKPVLPRLVPRFPKPNPDEWQRELPPLTPAQRDAVARGATELPLKS